jgi:hypothetical protein
MKFRDEVEKRGGLFRTTVYCFGEEEGEPYALCRWLRARKFKYNDVITMVEEATQVRAEPRAKDFYPDPVAALGCDQSVYIQQYPQLYSGNAKNGAPLFISKPGILNVDAMECITTLDGIVKYHWYMMHHDFNMRLKKMKETNPEFCRFECVCILDLEHLTTAQLGSRALAIIKQQTAIDSVCFPETLSRMVIVNAPRFFSLSWKLIKGWIDQRTANKIEIISSKSAWKKRLLELVDEDQLPSDYGGKSENTNVSLMKEAPGGMSRQHTELVTIRKHASHTFDVAAGEKVSISVYVTSTEGFTFELRDAKVKHGEPLFKSVNIVHKGTAKDHPTRSTITPEGQFIEGPCSVKVRVDSKSGMMQSDKTLLVFSVFPTSN